MRSSRITDLVDTLHDRVQRRVVADCDIRPIQIVVNRTGKSDNRHIEFIGKDTRSRQRTVASDHHERVDTMLHQLVMRLLTSFRGFELHATGRFQDRTATLYDIADILSLKFFYFIRDHPFIPAVDTFHRYSVING